MDPRMKVIFICTKSITFNTFLKSHAKYFIKKGLEVIVACSDSENLKCDEKIKYQIDFPKTTIQLFNLIKYIKIFFQILELTKKNNSALFYLHTPMASHLFRIFTFFKKVKIIYFVHGFRFTSNTNIFKSLIFKIVEKILSFKTNFFITINSEDYNYVVRNLTDKKKCQKINGVGLNIKLKKKIIIKKKNIIKKILVIAAYKKEKGYYELLKIAERIKDKNFNIECYGYGNFQKFNQIKFQKKLKKIKFNNFDSNLNKIIKNYDILLHLSKREGLPVSLMQSLSEGLPVICYNIRGNNDLIKDNINGLFVSSYKEVLGKILFINLNKNFYHKLRNNAIKTIDNSFSQHQINKKILKILNRIY
jgi:glycosyltransferase involved in cell wall biosynthesis